MTYLELCQRVISEAPVSGRITTVTQQTGQLEQVVNWVNTAYTDVQTYSNRWAFLRNELVFNTVPGVNNYTRDSIGIPTVRDWVDRKFRCRMGLSDTQMSYYTWDEFYTNLATGANRTVAGDIATVITVKPDQSLVVWPTPTSTPTQIVGEYFRQPYQLVNDTDTPIFLPEYHMIIVWKAVSYFAAQNAAGDIYNHADNEYRRILHNMRRQYL